MTVREIVTSENPLLRRRSKKVRQFDENLQELVDDMFETLHAYHGLGLAAPQIGVLQRVFIAELPAEYDEAGNETAPLEQYVFINPEIRRMRGEEEMEEGCLSVPGYRGVVKRATLVHIKGQGLNGRPFRVRATDLLAEVFQHEFDHLEGILYLDRLVSPDKLFLIPVGQEEANETVMAD